ncbi:MULTISPECIES: competence/damage-inducible protein A [Caproicibacterium]|jgi:nicotinamide-nucleotide amidase|uniref:Putative competence-damage inducible protein n=1 Tax=Caproicibacterium lactatifermentans TaxID=2666138 RepID=A0A859DND8_9FIRM|nr:competence/damage-inducible protein A [Caproicibacterium lactatifermentans]ARP51023.1 competence/damage-inducible protein A [Ruminococcaceae bacterium CPB6]MDD4807161.1 competence/damage-inducible protein A [Oscillospiraceae bacterium]QKN23250.1 competence/damage-inducible protein A [Caproicibacterium lactatifermentans]QKO30068.1 competence/damage-inducible protein A [Caproicibacterium lactatifermentans]
MEAEIISVGTELLLGQVVNSDTAYVARRLAEMGFDIRFTCVVGDNSDRLAEVLKNALANSDIVVATGGLGPTEDDLTKQTCAAAAGRKLVRDEDTCHRLASYFRGRTCSHSQMNQAMLPEGCTIFPNDHGTAPGCGFTTDEGKVLLMLPGPPRELVPMLQTYALPYLAQWVDGVIASTNIRAFGIGEGSAAEKIDDLVQGANPTAATYALEDEMYVRVTAKAKTKEEVQALCAPLADEVRRRLGDYVYGTDVDSLEVVVVRELQRQGKLLATAESCTGGMLAERITDISGASQVFHMGLVTYSNEVKNLLLGVPADLLAEKGAVCPETAAAMAQGVRRKAHADFGIGITGVAGPKTSEGKPVGYILIALDDGEHTWIRTMDGQGGRKERNYLRHRAASNALDLLRRRLFQMPMDSRGWDRTSEFPSRTAQK